jgi:predicted transcriptional regulator
MYTVTMPRTARKTQQITARLTDEGKRLLSLMATADGISESAVIERAIRELARKEGHLARQATPGHVVNER